MTHVQSSVLRRPLAVTPGENGGRREAGRQESFVSVSTDDARERAPSTLACQSSYSRGASAVTLREITDENRHAVLAVHVARAEKRFVGTVAGALIDAHEIPEGEPWYQAIYADDQPVGFVMLSWNVTPAPPRIIGPWFLWKLLVDEGQQRRGYGRRAGAGLPAHRLPPTGELDENGEIILALDLGGP